MSPLSARSPRNVVVDSVAVPLLSDLLAKSKALTFSAVRNFLACHWLVI